MQITRPKTPYLPVVILVLAGLLPWLLIPSHMATASMFNDSGHGSSDYGVNRSGVGEPTGNCVHCHEAYNPNNCDKYRFMLFYDDAIGICDLLCFTCHSGAITWQPVTNYPYSVNFGGGPQFYGTIYQQFCDANSTPGQCGSRHHLGQINADIKNDALGWGFNSDPDPCVACHNPHADQRNHPVDTAGGQLNVAIRRPSHYKSSDTSDSLWGDDLGERMDDYAASLGGTYQAPYYGDTSGTMYEPSGNASPSDGSDLPDYVTFCLDCHQYQLYDPERGKNVKAIDYALERHGGWPSNTCTDTPFGEGTLKAPYSDFANSNYVLSCLDCHEPHGTLNRLHLIRRVINGQVLAADTGSCDQPADFAEICLKCHDWGHPTWGGCTGCHGDNNSGNWHGTTFPFGTCLDEPSF